MKKLFITISLFFAINANAQHWQWLTSPNPLAGGMSYHGMDIDANANVYTIGQFHPSATFGSITLQATDNYHSLYFAKQTPNGDFVLAKRIWVVGGGFNKSIIKTDAAGNSYIFGTCMGTMLHIGTTDSLVLNNVMGPTVQFKFYMLKMSKDGNLLWAKTADAPNFLYAHARAMTIMGNSIFITGDYVGDVTFLGKAFPTVTSNACFLLKLDQDGNGIWMKRSNNSSMVFPTALATDGTSIFISGKFQDSISFGAVTIINPLASTGERVFLFRLNSCGTAVWGREEGEISHYTTSAADGNNPNALICDASGNLYMGGSYQDDAGNMNNTIQKPFVSKYDISTGTKLWTVTYSSAVNNAINGLAIDCNQNLIGLGEYNGLMSLDTFTLPTDHHNLKSMIFKLDKINGACLSVTPIGQHGYETIAEQIVMNNDHSAYYIAGLFRSYTRIDNISLNSSGYYTCFNAKYNFGPPTSSIRNPVAAQFSLYPNPANDQLIVALKSPEEGTVYIFNSMGQQVYQQSVHGIRTQLNIAHLPAGNYFLKGIFGEHSASRRFTKY